MTMTKFLVMPLMVVMLAACSDLKYYNSTGYAPVFECGHGVNAWLAELHETRGMSPEMLLETRDTWEKEFKKNPSVNNRMRLVLLLAVGKDPVRDRNRAIGLLEDVDFSLTDDIDQEFVNTLHQFLDEQDRTRSEKIILIQQVTEQSQRIDELEQQLHALTAIEQNIRQREKSGGE